VTNREFGVTFSYEVAKLLSRNRWTVKVGYKLKS